jgi:hypothetical protein
VTDGSVTAVARSGAGSLYVGGTFGYVGPYTGQAVALSADGSVAAAPQANGTVSAVVGDGNGGWYIAGTFTKVGAVIRNNIAHVLGDGSVDPAWDPNANGSVLVLALSGSSVYVGGTFTTIGGQARNRIAALDTTGTATGWNPNASSGVSALAVSDSTVYVGGTFTTIGGQARNRIAALDASGNATGWNPNASSTVSTLAVSGSTVYAGGLFTSIGGQARNRIAALDATGTATAWNPSANNSVSVIALDGATVYAAGRFSQIGGQSRALVAALDADGVATAWNPGANSTVVNALAVSNSTVYLGGNFTQVGGASRPRLAAVDSSGNVTSWNPRTNNVVNALATSGSIVYAGGAFTSAGGQARANLAEIDLASGHATSWNPTTDGPVYALTVDGSTIYAGGNFSQAGGQPRASLAAFDGAGNATAWNPGASYSVYTLSISNSIVYVGGAFLTVGGQSRRYLAALDASGNATSWNPSPNNMVTTIATVGSLVYAGGTFTQIASQPRNYIAAIDSTGAATTFNPAADGYVSALTVFGSTVYAGGSFFAIGGQSRHMIAALDSTGSALAWNPNANGTISALAVSGSTTYAGGLFTQIGGQARNRLAAIDADGNATAWNPNASAGVASLFVSGSTVYAGGAFSSIGGVAAMGFAAFATPPVNTTPPAISGSPLAGHTLTVTPGAWDNDAASYAYQWLRDGSPIGGATSVTYALAVGDAQHHIGVRVSATNAGGTITAESAGLDVDTEAPAVAPLVHTAEPSADEVQSFTDDVTATATTVATGVTSITLNGLAAGNETYEVACGDGSACPQTATHVFHVDAAKLQTGATNSLSVTATDTAGKTSTARAFTIRLKASCAQTDTCANATDICADPVASSNAGGGSSTPTLTDTGDALTASGTTVDTTVSKNAEHGVLLQTDDVAVCLTPTETASQAATAKIVDNGRTAQIDNTATATNTQVVPKADGAETFDTIKSPAAPQDYSWTVDVPAGDTLQPQADGSVAIVDPTPTETAPVAPAPTAADPSQIPALKASGDINPDAQPPDPAAVTAANNAAASSGIAALPAPAADGSTQAAQSASHPPAPADTELPTTPPTGDSAALPVSSTPPSGLTEPTDLSDHPALFSDQIDAGATAADTAAKQDAQQEADIAQSDLHARNAQQDADNRAATVDAPTTATVGVIEAPTATDAAGASVPTTLSVDGDTVTMHVNHQDGSYQYPISADPWVRINDYTWVDHCCRPVYTWQPRSHLDWRFDYIGSYWGHATIVSLPHYLWGYGNDGKALYNVYVGWGRGQWVLLHNETWSGVFVPTLITVQDAPVQVLTGWTHWSSYEYVGSHLEWHFDPAVDCASRDSGGYPSECLANVDPALVDDQALDDPASVELQTPATPRSTGTFIPSTVRIVSIGGPSNSLNPNLWATFRSKPGAWVIGNVRNGWTITTRFLQPGIFSNGHGYVDWYLGNIDSLSGFAASTDFPNPIVQCGWVEVLHTEHSGGAFSGVSNCGNHAAGALISAYASATNCGGRSDCTDGTKTHVTSSNVPMYANVALQTDGHTSGGRDQVGHLDDNDCVNWRYITRDGKFFLVRIPGRPNSKANWVFIPSSALRPVATLPVNNVHCP